SRRRGGEFGDVWPSPSLIPARARRILVGRPPVAEVSAVLRYALLLPLLFVAPIPAALVGPIEGEAQGPTTTNGNSSLDRLLAAGPTPPAPIDKAEPPPPRFHHVQLNGHTFTPPEGFTIELAAAPPLADRPIVAAFDDKGRLYVCDSSGSNEPTKVQVEKKPHRIVRLEDTDGDGKFDKSTVFVSNVMLPEGAMW